MWRGFRMTRRRVHAGKQGLKLPGNAIESLECRRLLTASFAAPIGFPVGTQPQCITSADFNGDGKADVAAASMAAIVSVFLSNGDGTFKAKAEYTGGSRAEDIASGDLNGDGKADLALADYNDDSVNVLLNNGDGTFAENVGYQAAKHPRRVVMADFNGDGKLDLAASADSQYVISVFLNKGDGTFLPRMEAALVDHGYPTTGALGVASADFNGDGKADLAVTKWNGNSVGVVGVLLGHGDGTFDPERDYATGEDPVDVTAADFNGDGAADLAVADNADGYINILLNKRDGTFYPKTDYTFHSSLYGEADYGQPWNVTSADMTGDGLPDVVVANSLSMAGAGKIVLANVLENKGDGTFVPGVAAGTVIMSGGAPIPIATYTEDTVAVGDFNCDGRPDFAVTVSAKADMELLLNTSDNNALQELAAGPAVVTPGNVITATFTQPKVWSRYVYHLSNDRFWNDADDTVMQAIGTGPDGTVQLAAPAQARAGACYVLARPAIGALLVTPPNAAERVGGPKRPLLTSNAIKVLAVPANDMFSARPAIVGLPAGVNGNNANATKETGEPEHALYSGGHSVWWSWTAPASGRVTIDTAGSSFRTLLGVYVGSKVSALSTVASNKDLGSAVSFNAVKGRTYAIAVDGYQGAVGSIRLTISAGVLDEKQAMLSGSWREMNGGYQGKVTYTGRGSGANVATWTFSNLAGGTYRVSATWLKMVAAATNAPFKVYDGTKLLGTVLVNEKLGPVGTSYDGAVWQGLGTFKIASGSLVIKLSNYANGYVVADGVRVERIG